MVYSNCYGYPIRRAYCLNITSQKDVYVTIKEISSEKKSPLISGQKQIKIC